MKRYLTEHRSSTGFDILVTRADGTHPKLIGFINMVPPGLYKAERKPYDLGLFESVSAAKAAIVHEFNRPLNIDQCYECDTSTGAYA